MILNRVPPLSLALAVAAAAASASAAGADPTNVPNANPKSPGIAAPNVLSPELIETIAAQGSNPIENPVAGMSRPVNLPTIRS